MAHQGGKIKNKEERMAMYKWISDLEFKMYGLKVPDIKIFLHMSYEGASLLKKDRAEMADQNENNKEHLKQAELAYLEIAKKYHFKTIECMKDKQIKTKEEISQIIQKYVLKKITE
jgi:dTMP kinase